MPPEFVGFGSKLPQVARKRPDINGVDPLTQLLKMWIITVFISLRHLNVRPQHSSICYACHGILNPAQE
jgi:hypothetical protein